MSADKSAYPILLTCLDQVLTVVIGGGAVAERKITGLLAANARIRLISPQATSQLVRWAGEGKLDWQQRKYLQDDLDGAWMIFAATNDRAVNVQIAEAAQQRGILCNVVDSPADGNFNVPAVYRGLQEVIAVSTYAEKPALAASIRNRIADWLKEGGL